MSTRAKTYLTATEKAAYLANVLSISKSQDQMNDLESQVLQGIINSLDATWEDIQKANRMLANGTTSLRRMKSQHVKRDNIEDMIAMALADGDLTPGETEPIEKLTEMLGYSQADMDLLVKRAETKLAKMKTAAPPVPAAPKRRHEPHEIVPEPIAAPRPPPKPPTPPPAPVPVTPPDPPAQPAAPTPPPATAQPTPQPQDLTTLTHCQNCRSQSEHQSEYCFGLGSGRVNVWGCRMMDMDWAPEVDWLLDGSFRDDGTFVFDHNAIAKRIETAVDKVRACPHLSLSVIEEALRRLPKRATTWGRWRYRECKITQEGATQVDAVTYLHGQRISERKTVCGLDPDGIHGALKIIRRTMNNAAAQKLDTSLFREEHQ